MSLRRPGVVTEMTTGKAGVATESEVITYSSGELWDGTSRLVIALHGHGTAGQDAAMPQQFNQNVGSGAAAMALARTGRYIVCAIQADGAVSWSNPRVMLAINSAIKALRARGAKPGKYALLGWSMGGLEVANRIKRDAPNIAAAWTWAPAIDLDYVFSTAGHTPAAGNATWTTEATTAFGTYAASAGYRVADEPAAYRGLGVPWKIVHALDDAIIPQSISTSFVAAVNDPNITMRTPDVTGGHTDLFSSIPDSEIVAFFDAGKWQEGTVTATFTGPTFAELDGSIAQPVIAGHRGDVARRPEEAIGSYAANNTEWPLPQFALEVDFGLTSDGMAVAMHDDTLDRTTDGTGLISDKTAAEIAALNIKDLTNFGITSNPPLKIPTLQQFLDMCKSRVALVEAKGTPAAQAMVPVIQNSGVAPMLLTNAFTLGNLQPFIDAGLPTMMHDPDNSGLTPQQLKDAGITHVNWRSTNVATDVDPYLAVGLKVWSGGASRYEWANFCGRRVGGIADDAMWVSGAAPVLAQDAFASPTFAPGHIPYTPGAPGALIDRGDGVRAWAPGFVNSSGIGDQGNGWTLMGHLSPHPKSRTAPWDYGFGFGALPAVATYPWGYEFDVTYLEAGDTPTRRWGIALAPNDRPFHDTVTGATAGYATAIHGDQSGTVFLSTKGQSSTRQNAASAVLGPVQAVGQTVRWRIRRKSVSQVGIICVTTNSAETLVAVTANNPELYQGGYLWLGNPGVAGATGRWAFSNIVAV